jgi:hypothetical protein
MSHTRKYPPEEVARYFQPVQHGDGWAIRALVTGELLTWPEGSPLGPAGSPRVFPTREKAEEVAEDVMRRERAMMTGFATGLLEDG